MIEADYKFYKIEEYKDIALKEHIYNIHSVRKYQCCPYCGFTHFIKHGKYDGIQRYKCKNEQCGRTFSSTTYSVWKYLKHKPEKWIRFVECMCENLTLKLCAKKLGISVSTAFYWRHKVFHAVENYYRPESFKNSVTVKDYSVTKCYKGSRNKNFTYEEKIKNKIARFYGSMPTDVKILISAEDDDFPLISVEYEDKKVEKIFKKDVLNNVEKECYIHLYSTGKSDIRECIINYNKTLSKTVRKRYGFKVKKDWIGIYDMHDDFQICRSMKEYIPGLCCWIWHFKGIATKYIKHYYGFYSLVNSVKNFDYMIIFKELLKNGFYTSVESFKNTHLENY